MNYFQNIFETEVNDVHMNHTPTNATIVSAPSKSAYLFWQSGMTGMEAADKAIGPGIALSVTPGDTIKAETYARYEDKTSYNRTGFTLSVLSALLGNSFAYVEGFEGSTLAQTTQKFSDALTVGGFLGDTGDDSRPYAYLNYIVFDQSMTRITSDWVRVPEDGAFDPGEEGLPGMHARVALDEPLVIPANGQYIYLWVSNESENTKVWFDDIKVTHVTTFVAQATDYGVWGDVLREQKTDESIYRYAYQGQFSELDLETGWSHFELREYDPIIGRWLVTDPYGQYWSPYIGMGNNPVSGIDPDGGCTGGDCPDEPVIDGGTLPEFVMVSQFEGSYAGSLEGLHFFDWGSNNSFFQFDDVGNIYQTINLIEGHVTYKYSNNEWSVYRDEAHLANAYSANLVAAAEFTGLLYEALISGAIGGFNGALRNTSLRIAATKSSLKLGQQMHKMYKVEQVLEGVRVKEYILPSGKRIDFIDFANKIIYELKPNNSRAIKLGNKQLKGYLKEVEGMLGEQGQWRTVLDAY